LVINRGNVVIVANNFTIAMEIYDGWGTSTVNIEAAGNGYILLYGNEMVTGIRRGFGKVLPGIKNEGKKFWLVQCRIIRLLRHIS
jgi:hypothetical protein